MEHSLSLNRSVDGQVALAALDRLVKQGDSDQVRLPNPQPQNPKLSTLNPKP